MIFNTIIGMVTSQGTMGKKNSANANKRKYLSQRYHERSIVNRYFK